MEHNWILKIIADIEIYAKRNDLYQIRASLDELRIIATAEIALMTRLEAELRAANAQPAASNVIALPRQKTKANHLPNQTVTVTTQII